MEDIGGQISDAERKSAEQQATADQTSTARVDPNRTNANATGVPAEASGLSLFFAFRNEEAAATEPTDDATAPADKTALTAPDQTSQSALSPDALAKTDGTSEQAAPTSTDPQAIQFEPGSGSESGTSDREASNSSGQIQPVDPTAPAASESYGEASPTVATAPATETPSEPTDDTENQPQVEQDLYDVSAISDADAAANAVDENAAIGSSTGITAFASDGDTTRSAVTYTLTDNAGGRFTIDAKTGVVTVAGPLDRETGASYSITVLATSADGSTSTQTYAIAINDVDEFDVSAISDMDAAADAVDENAAIGSAVGITAFASDADASNSGITYSLTNDAGGRFAIDASTGVVTVAGIIDREAGATQTITVKVTSADGSTSTQTYTIAINDLDEFDVSPVTDTNAAPDTLAEDAAAGTAVGIVASASDADATNSAITYSVDDARFTVDPDGTVRVASGATFDYETEPSIAITVTATSADGSTSAQGFTFAVTDVNESAVSAVGDSNAAANSVDENSAIGTTVGITAFASDADGTATVTYTLSDSAGGKFAIDANTGVVTVAGSLDRETAASYQIEVTATSSDGSSSTQSYTIAINDLDEFDVSPVSDTSAAPDTLAEDASAGTAVGIVASASDADATNSAITYSVDDSRFTVDPDGTVRVAAGASFDYETEPSIAITVTATSADGSTSSQGFTLAVTDANEAAVSSISDANAASNSVDENSAVGTTVGITAFASDSDGTATVTYSLSDNAGGKFAIDATTGVVTVAGSLDRETAASYQIEVTATSSDGSSSTQSYTIAINDLDEFDISPVTDSNAAPDTLAEDAAAGTAVGIVASASDADATNSAITYSVDDARFTVDPDGTVRVAAGASFDYETEPSIAITVTATSADGSTSTQGFTLAVTDVNESAVSSISDANAASNSVDENSAVGTTVGITAFASDADGTATVTYSLTDSAGGRFAIDASTGVVTVAGALDRETAASYQIEVTATSSDGSTSTQTYTIAINDLDEFDVSPVSDTNAAPATLAEDAAAGTAVGIVASASDADATNSAITYSVDDARFTVDPDGTVRVATGASFDYETEPSIAINVTATSADGSTSSQGFTLAVTDVNEAAVSAISDSNAASNSVDENATVGTTVGITAFASDSDGTATMTYSLSDNAGGKFAIDASTGVVTVAGPLDRETAASYQIEVTATSSDGSTSTQTYTIAINDLDEFDVSPVGDTNAAPDTLAEDAAAGTAVGIVASASDADATNSAITYSVDDARFTVDAEGTVRVAAGASFDYETEPSIAITVTATSADGSTSSQGFTLAVTDVNEASVGAVSDTNAASNSVDENSAVGTTVGITAFASDSDGTATVTYSLSDSAGGKFAINASTGVVTIAGSLDRETAASYQIEVTATSSDGSSSTQSYTIAINDLDEFDVSPVSDTSAAPDTLAENATAGTAVGIVASASDADATNSAITYSVDDSRFTVDPDGTVRVAAGASFDYETEPSIAITVTATSADGSSSTQGFTLTVTDVNEAAVSAVSDTNAASNSVDENSAVGTTVGITAFASDSDGTDSVTYSLSNDAGGKFAIDATTGVVTVAGSIDRETAASYQIEVTATSTDGSTSTQTYTIAINDLDEFDVSPVSDTSAAPDTLAEDASAGTAVGIVASASDADATNSAITYSVDDSRFTVDPDGTVRVAAGASFDYETEPSIAITVTATSADGSTSSQGFTLAVTDANEAAVSSISDANAASNSVDENSAVGTTVGITAFASDSDGTDNVTYSLSDSAGGKFAIDAATGVVTVAGSLDRETAASYQIEVTATSSDGSTSTQSYSIAINDLDEFDVSPVTDTNAAPDTLAEDAAAGTAVGIVASASDADATNSAISYSVDDSRFTVDPDGTVRVAAGASFDYETEPSIAITVTATSADGSTSTQGFTLAVTDVNEAAVSAISDSNAASNSVDENATVGTTVGITAFASDSDGTATMTYSLSDNAGGKFAIDASTGVVTVAGPLDRETAASYQIEVTATSSDGSTSTQSYTIAINDLDEFDVSPVSDTNAAPDTLAEDAAAGTAVGIVAAASDADATNSAITYSVDDSRFTVDPDGTVRVATGASFDYETEPSIAITVTATSADGSTSTQDFTLSVTDVNESAVSAVSDSNAASNSVDENSAVGTTVGITAFASDADGTATVTYSLSDSAGGKFAIDAATGVVTVAGPLDRETAASYQIEVTATSSDGSTSTQTYTIAINDLDEFDVSPVSDTNAAPDTLAEDAAAGTAVGIVATASDADATNSAITYSVDDARFTVDADGTVRVAPGASFDYETEPSIAITVTATSADGSTSTQGFTLAVTDVNESAVSSISDANAASNSVDENSAIGTTVGITAFASDSDGTDNVTYSLSDSAGGKFAIDAATGVVTVAGSLDRETAASYQIEVTATSTDGSTSTQTYTIAINDLDEFDISPVSDTNATANAVNENAAVGTTVGVTAFASDADATTNGVTYSLTDSAGGKFAINATTGVVTVAGAIDREAGATQTITVQATSADGSTSTQSYVITINDMNEFAVSPISDTNASSNAVNENAAIGTTVGITAFASDADATTNGVTYSLTDSAGGKFAINATTGVVTVAGAIDREAGATQTITVQATSADGSTSTQSYVITINDVNEFAVSPISDTNATANAVNESADVGTTVGITAFASDADATTNGVTYSLTDSAGGKFAINATTGVVTVAGAIDREAGATQTITVQATSADGSTSTQSYVITINDVNEFAVSPISDTNASANAVNENAAIGTTVGITAFASDADATTNGVTYSLIDSAGGKFAINATTGVVTVAGAIDREAGATQTITVQATSADGSTSTQSYVITINDVNEFAVSPISDTNASANAVNENAAVGTTVGITAFASDADATTNGVTYSLSNSAGGKFAINATTGVVTVAGAIDREAAATQTITVVATSADGSTSSQSYTITVNDVNEFAVSAISDSNAAANSVNENAAIGTTVGITASATDADATTNTVTYSLLNDNGGKFAINATTGVVTVAGALDYEAGATRSITVLATSADGSTSTKTFTINLNDVYEGSAPTDLTFSPNAGLGNASSTIAAGTTLFSVASVKDTNSTDTFTYSLVNNPSTMFSINSTTGAVTTNWAQAPTNGTTTMTVRVTDSSGKTYDEIVDVYSGDGNGNNIVGGNNTSFYVTAGGNDTITAGSGDDMIFSGTGDDYVSAGKGNDIVYMGDGNDTFDTSGGVMDDDGDDYIDGGAGNDIIYAGAGNDTLIGGSGDDYLYGEDGNDLLIGGAGIDYIDGGAGTDTVDYSTSGAAVAIDLGAGTASGGDAQGDTIVNVENITGSAYNDTLTGNSGANVLSGGAGNDILNGGGGNDTLIGGAGSDTIDGGTGIDTVSYETSSAAVTVNLATGVHSGGDAAGDTITNVENITGSNYNDTLTGDSNANTISGGAGNDTISGGGGDDILIGGTGNDTLSGGSGNDTFIYSAGDGNDSVAGGAAGGWTDVISLQGMDGAITITGQTVAGHGWTMQLDAGTSIVSQAGESLTLSNDAHGTITFDDGSTLTFTEIEKVTW